MINTGSLLHTHVGVTYNFSNTISAGNNQVVYVAFHSRAAITTRAVTYNSVAMTEVAIASYPSARVYLFRLVNPPVGTYTVDYSGSSSAPLYVTVESYADVNQSTPNGTIVTATGGGAGSDPSVTVTSSTGAKVIDFVSVYRSAGATNPYTVGAGQTVLEHDLTNNGDGTCFTAAASEEAGAASVTMSWDFLVSDWAQIAVPLIASNNNFLLFFNKR